jgi:hypothetical protein
MFKQQASLERGILLAIGLVITIMVMGIIFYFMLGINKSSSFAVSAIKILNASNGFISFELFTNTKLPYPNNVSIFINSTQIGFNTSGMSYQIEFSNGTYGYIYTGKINSNVESILLNSIRPTLLIQTLNFNKQTVYSSTDVLLNTINYKPLVNKVTFYIFPPTTDFGISLSNYTSLIENGQTLYLQNGEYTLKAVQTNSSSEYYFDFWNATSYSGTLEITGGYKNPTTSLYIDNTTGAVMLFLNAYMNITFTSNNNSAINEQLNYVCGSANSRFCIDNSVRNLVYIYRENSSKFSFAYPSYIGNASKLFRIGFVGYVNNSYSCPVSNPKSNIETNQHYDSYCIVNATYEPEYYISATSSNSIRGLVAIKFFNGTQTPFSSSVSGWSEKGSTNQFIAKANIDYKFVNWTGTNYSTGNPFYAVVNGPMNETANFVVNPPNITFEANYGGMTVSISVNSNSIGTETVPYVYTFNNFTNIYIVNWTWTSNVSGYTFSSESFGCGNASTTTSSPTGSYTFDNTCQNYIVIAKYNPPPPPPPPSGPYYIYGCIINSSGACVQTLNGTSFSIPVGHYNTSLTSNKSVAEQTFPFPSGGYTGNNGASYNIATVLNNGYTLTLKLIVGVGYCGYSGLDCSGTYTNWLPYYGGHNLIAEYSCSGSGCPTGSNNGGGGSGGSGGLPGSPSYTFKFENVSCVYVSGTSATQCSSNLVSGTNYVSLSPKQYSASYINSNHPTFVPSTSVVSYVSSYPYSSEYQYQFVKSAQKIVYGYPSPTTPGHPIVYAYCWWNSTTNSTTLPTTDVYVNSLQNGTACQQSGTAQYSESIQNITSYSYYTLVHKTSTITVYNYPGFTNNDYIKLSATGVTFNGGTPQKIQSGNGYINETVYTVGYSPSTKTYNLSIYGKTTKYSYLLLIKDLTTNSYVSIPTNPPKTGNYYNMSGYPGATVTLNTSDNYAIYAVYFIPVTIETYMLGSSFNFSSINWQTLPYYTNLAGFNENKVAQSITYYALPPSSSYIPNYQGYSYKLQDGFWSNGKFYADPPVLGNYGNAIACAEGGSVKNCITYESYTYTNGTIKSGGSKINRVNTQGLPTVAINATNDYKGNLVNNCPSQYGGYSLSECMLYPYQDVWYNGWSVLYPIGVQFNYSSLNATIEFYGPSKINLQYGYFIPVYYGINGNYSGWCGTQPYSQTFSTLSDALTYENNTNFNIAYCSILQIGRPHPVLNLYMENIYQQNQPIYLPNKNETLNEFEKGTYMCPSDVICPVYSQWYTVPVYQNGFTTQAGFNNMPGVLVANQGSSSINEISSFGEIYYQVTASLPTNWNSANGYLLYQYDKNH